MRVAICDDEAAQRELLKKLLTKWARQQNIELTVLLYPNAESFAYVWEDDKAFDLLILDIEMGKCNGMELAVQIRRTDEQLPILFITGYDKYMAQGYEVEALHYLLKPVREEKLYEVLNRLQRKQKPEEKLFFQGEDGVLSLSLSHIWYVEAFGHRSVIHSDTQEWVLRQSISEVEKILSGHQRYIRCHRSYLVNLRRVSYILKSEIVLDNEQKLPLSRQLAKEVNQAFLRNYKNS